MKAGCAHAQVEGMWPYWLDGFGAGTVRNSFQLDSMVLLTGARTASSSPDTRQRQPAASPIAQEAATAALAHICTCPKK